MVEKYLEQVFYTHYHFTWLSRSSDIKVEKSIPHIFIEGSKAGYYTSTIHENNILINNPQLMGLMNHYNKIV